MYCIIAFQATSFKERGTYHFPHLPPPQQSRLSKKAPKPNRARPNSMAGMSQRRKSDDDELLEELELELELDEELAGGSQIITVTGDSS